MSAFNAKIKPLFQGWSFNLGSMLSRPWQHRKFIVCAMWIDLVKLVPNSCLLLPFFWSVRLRCHGRWLRRTRCLGPRTTSRHHVRHRLGAVPSYRRENRRCRRFQGVLLGGERRWFWKCRQTKLNSRFLFAILWTHDSQVGKVQSDRICRTTSYHNFFLIPLCLKRLYHEEDNHLLIFCVFSRGRSSNISQKFKLKNFWEYFKI
jgi:hypothetical protein